MAQVKVQFNRGVEGATNIVDAGTEGTKVALVLQHKEVLRQVNLDLILQQVLVNIMMVLLLSLLIVHQQFQVFTNNYYRC